MAAKASTCTADLKNIPATLSYLKDVDISLKSRQQGFRFFSKGYFHGVNMCMDDENTTVVTAKCHRNPVMLSLTLIERLLYLLKLL